MTRYAPGTPCWADLSSPDLPESQRFYTGVFGWTAQTAPEPEAMGYTTFYRGDQAVVAVGPLMSEGQPPAWTTYFATDDADAAAQRVDSAGGKILMAPMDVMGFGRMAIFLDPVGAAFAVWQAGTMAGADVIGEPGSMGWFELMTRDPEASKAFYSAVIGLTPRDVEYGPVTYTLWEQDGKSLGGMMPMEGDQWPVDLPPHWMLYFVVEDCDATVQRVGELGGAVPVPAMDTPAGRMAVVSDPHGATFSVMVPNPDFQP
jgi:predicted enzyme related to lactoylglutathione lyase